MKILHYLVFASFIIINSLGLTAYAKTQEYALIYSGVNTCEGCPEAIAEVAKKAGLPIKYVSDARQIPHLLNHAAIFIIGGTEDNIEPMRLAFNKNIVSSIKKYVSQGGRYLGICGGGFIAAEYYMAEANVWVRGFNIIPAQAFDYSKTAKAHLENVQWNGKNVLLYFQGGPQFILEKNAKSITVIARYRNGEIAAFESSYGKGKVVVVGPHPEADKTWLLEDNIDSSKWKPTQKLAVDLLRKMLSQ